MKFIGLFFLPIAVKAILNSDAEILLESRAEICAYDPTAKVSDACASYAYLDSLNAQVNDEVHELVTNTDFFSFYRLNLYNKKCPFWSDENGMCGNIACAVTTVDNEEDVPEIWRSEELGKLEGPKAHHPDKKKQKEHKPLHGELGTDVGESCVVEYDDECDERDYCVPEDESATGMGDYVSLEANPERFTGYAGEGAHQVWDAIYRENCFSRTRKTRTGLTSGLEGISPHGVLSGEPAQASRDLRSIIADHGRQQAMQAGSMEDNMEFDDECIEKRVFYRVISGMHASISTHLCHDYLNQTTGEWLPNLQCYKERLHKHPERIANLYFNYALILRAVGKLKNHIQGYTFCSGDPIEDKRTKQIVYSLASSLPGGPELFDESILFQDTATTSGGVTLKEDFKSRFRNISRIMDCVGCDKCRLWGKLQTNGYGTALKILFEFENGETNLSKPLLRRTELVALLNTLDKVSVALKFIKHFQKLLNAEAARVDDDSSDESFNATRPRKRDNGKFQKGNLSVTESFWVEWNQICKAFGMVMRSWIALPNNL